MRAGRSSHAVTLSIAVTLVLAACGGDGGGGDNDDVGRPATATATPVAGATPGANPAPPSLSAEQLDRVGRPLASFLLSDPFDADVDRRNAARAAYTVAADPARWAAEFQASFEASLAVYDAIDATCGTQLFASTEPAAPDRYELPARIFVDDRLYVDTQAERCEQYLAVEVEALRVPNEDCGGRRPSYDVVDVTYSALVIGGLSGVPDAVAADDGTTGADFPFLGPPR